MEKIKIGESVYDIIKIRERPPLLTIEFPEPVEVNSSRLRNLVLLTDGGILCRELTEYTTIFRTNENILVLSSDGSVFTEQETVEPYIPTPEDLLNNTKQSKLSEVSRVCQNTTYAGTDINTSKGRKHFSLNIEDQTNISFAYNAVKSGASEFPYHADGELCTKYPAIDIIAIADGATAYKLWHTTYCNHLNVWINRCTTIEEVNNISYGIRLPADLEKNFLSIVGE